MDAKELNEIIAEELDLARERFTGGFWHTWVTGNRRMKSSYPVNTSGAL